MTEKIKVLLIGVVSLMAFSAVVFITPGTVFGYGYSYGYGDNYYEDCVLNDGFFCNDIEFADLEEISFSPSNVNTDLGDQEITMTAHITDNSAGFGYLYVKLRSVKNYSETIFFSNGSVDIIEGNATDVIITKTITLPEESAAGDWRVEEITIGDGNFNYIMMDRNDLKTEDGRDIIAFVNDAEEEDNDDEDEDEEELVCYDWDGDGWGWDGEKGCKIEDDDDNNDDEDEDNEDEDEAGECIDWDGDGWGWDGEKGCQMPNDDEDEDNDDEDEDEDNDDEDEAGECIDWDGDGWGWDGEKGCEMPSDDEDEDEDEEEDEEDELECIDWDGDGWGWDGEKGCRME